MKPFKIAGGIALAAVVVALRIVNLDADPPAWLSWSAGICTDEGFYAADARQVVMHGHWSPGDFHGAVLSPTLYWLQLQAFRLFGPSLWSARIISVVFGSLCVLLLFQALRLLYNSRVAWMGAVFLGFSTPFVFYNRLALMETPAAALLTAALAGIAYAQRCNAHRACKVDVGGENQRADQAPYRVQATSAAVGLAFGAALVTKILAAPAGLALGLWCAQDKEKRKWIWVLLGVAIPAALSALLVTGPYALRLQTMDRYYLAHQFLPHSLHGLLGNFSRAFWSGRRDGLLPALMKLDPVMLLCGILGIAVALRRRILGDVLLLGWLLPIWAVFACLSYTPTRYDVLFLPALAGLAAALFERAPIRWVSAACVLFVLLHAVGLGEYYRRPESSVLAGSARLSRLGGMQDVVLGQTAPELCLGNSMTPVMVQPGLANDVRPVERFHANLVVVSRSPYWDNWWRSRYPAIVCTRNRMDTIEIGHRIAVDVYRVPVVSR